MPHPIQLKLLFKRLSIALAIALLPSIAFAGGTATMVTTSSPMQLTGQTTNEESNKITIVWKDSNNMRMDFGDPSYYILVRNGKTYSIMNQGGRNMVIDVASMGEMFKAIAGQNETDNPFGSIESVKATNKSETVAGIKGNVYQIKWIEHDGTAKSDEAVLTNNPLVVEMTNTYSTLISAIAGSDHMQTFWDELPENNRGMLKMGNQFYVESIQKADHPSSTFELPSQPMNFQEMIKSMTN